MASPTKLTYKRTKTSTHKIPIHLRSEYKAKRKEFREQKKEHKKLIRQKSSDPYHQHRVDQSDKRLQAKKTHIDAWFETNAVERTKRFRDTRKFFSRVNRKASNALNTASKPFEKAYNAGRNAYGLYKGFKASVQESAPFKIGKAGFQAGSGVLKRSLGVSAKGMGAVSGLVSNGTKGASSAGNIGSTINEISSSSRFRLDEIKNTLSDRMAFGSASMGISTSSTLPMPHKSVKSTKQETPLNKDNTETYNQDKKERREDPDDEDDDEGE